MSLGHRQPVSRKLTDPAIKNQRQLVKFFMRQNPDADKKEVKRLAEYYIEESLAEGINSDCAFVQMCLETGFLRFGNLVTPEMHNYCGLGSIDENNRGESFETEQLGVRAHIQHLHAYATEEDVQLNNELIDRRYKWVNPRGKAPTVFELAGTWAADREYGNKLDTLLSRLEGF
ncbi:MAG: glucosaminidase domain-containing protein [Treponema sp.]|nr:glucosaminidase domain-containing protein [Treponema sp.]MBP5754184.1 glucosaminidase domain-containing protein [Treponema sp.]